MEAQAGRLRPTTPDEEGEEAFLFLSLYIYIYIYMSKLSFIYITLGYMEIYKLGLSIMKLAFIGSMPYGGTNKGNTAN
jgi:hypothetical protein